LQSSYIGEDSSLDLFFDEFLSVTDPIKIKILNQSVKNFTRGGSNPQIKDMMIGFAIHPFLVCKAADCFSGCAFYARKTIFMTRFQQTIINQFV
jgi:hypothetical protein